MTQISVLIYSHFVSIYLQYYFFWIFFLSIFLLITWVNFSFLSPHLNWCMSQVNQNGGSIFLPVHTLLSIPTRIQAYHYDLLLYSFTLHLLFPFPKTNSKSDNLMHKVLTVVPYVFLQIVN